EDLPLLVARIARELGAEDHPFVRDEKFLASLRRHDWPGNVRELRNHLEASISLDAPAELGAREKLELPLARARQEFERSYLEAMLRRHDGNVSAAARAAGVDRAFFYRMLWRTGLR